MDNDKALLYIYRHVFLPPKLPHTDDFDVVASEALKDAFVESLKDFQKYVPRSRTNDFSACLKMVEGTFDLKDGENLSAEKLDVAIRAMNQGDTLAMHIRGQNAALMIRKFQAQYSFESFELLSTTHAVTNTKGRLTRYFPGPAIAVDSFHVENRNFLTTFTRCIADLDVNTPREALPVSRKAGSSIHEIRDTVSPRFVTEMITSILHAIGRPFDARRIQKNTRDEVLWGNVLLPWQRSALWLFLRTTVQLRLLSHDDGKDIHVLYKSFMIYFMTTILDKFLELGKGSEMLYIMQAKIARRILKLNPTHNNQWLQNVECVLQRCSHELKRRWATIEEGRYSTPSWDLLTHDFADDCILSLHKLDPYLKQADTWMSEVARPSVNIPTCFRPFEQITDTLPNAETLSNANQDGLDLLLADVESWVEWHLSDWLNHNLTSATACSSLGALIYAYEKKAYSKYANFPEDCSIMYLTCIDLWMALDQCACVDTPLLEDYDPGFSDVLFDPLILRSKSQVARILRAERYLKGRKSNSKCGSELIFASVNSRECFAVQYFESSKRHRDLRKLIIENAKEERAQKCVELKEKRQKYDQLLEQSDSLQCEYIIIGPKKGRNKRRHSGDCPKCALKAQAGHLKIGIHEWPLSKNVLEAKATVFELDVPNPIFWWRDITYHLVVNVFSAVANTEYSSQFSQVWTLSTYDGLKRFAKITPGIVGLASDTKPCMVSHYRQQCVSAATESTICLENGLHLKMFDSHHESWISKRLTPGSIKKQCTHVLPDGLLNMLQDTVDDTGHTSNEIIARQDSCPFGISCQEYYSFGTLRAGHRIQWRNLARELGNPALDFNREETYILITQTILQLGPCGRQGTQYRESHEALRDENFGLSLLEALDEKLFLTEDNWQGATSVKTFIEIATRILALAPSHEVKTKCFRLLKRARKITLRWCQDLSGELLGVCSDARAAELRLQILQLSLICHSTFNVDHENFGSIIETKSDFAELFECMVRAHDCCPPRPEGLSASLKRMIRQNERLSHTLEPFIKRNFQAASLGLDEVINRLWESYQSGINWRVLTKPNQCWIMAEARGEFGNELVSVHFNLLSGELLINGSPFSRLPSTYEAHPTYRRLLGEKILNVVPSTMPGMRFESQQKLHGWQLQFCLRGNDLVIRATQSEQIWEFVPDTALEGDFPKAFVRDFVHWRDLGTGIIEWRPLTSRWITSSNNWKSIPGTRGNSLVKGGSNLIDIRSPAATALYTVFQPLEEQTHMHLVVNQIEGILEVRLPRMRLEFIQRKNSPEFESKQFRGMVIDEDQSIGTLSGLASKLVLRQLNGSKRMVIVPHGNVNFEKSNDHVKVQIEKDCNSNIRFHVFEIDRLLNRVNDRGSLTTKLFRCLLHATTSHHLPDQLTGKTGTEEALSILQEASTRSFYRLEDDDIVIIQKIANLTPRREFYPSHLRVMQNVRWINLPSLSQHPSFWELAKELYASIRNQSVFHQDECGPVKEVNFAINQEHLLEKMAIRSSAFRTDGFGAECFTTQHDIEYQSREILQNDRENRVRQIAKLVNEWATGLTPSKRLLSDLESWRKPLQGWNIDPEERIELGYSPAWLEPIESFFPSDWMALQMNLSRCNNDIHKYPIMFFLSTLAYSEYAKLPIIHTLLAFATVPAFRNSQIPRNSITLSDGYAPSPEQLFSTGQECYRPYSESPERNLAQLPDENKFSADRRRKNLHGTRKQACLKDFVDSLVRQWPTSMVQDLNPSENRKYIQVSKALDLVNKLFLSWHNNFRFKACIDSIQNVLEVIYVERHEGGFQCYSFQKPNRLVSSTTTYISLAKTFEELDPVVPTSTQNLVNDLLDCERPKLGDYSRVEELCHRMASRHHGDFERQFLWDMMSSLQSLRSRETIDKKFKTPLLEVQHFLRTYYQSSKKSLESTLLSIRFALQEKHGESVVHRIVSGSNLWPRISILQLLTICTRRNTIAVSKEWVSTLLSLGLAITEVQRAQRLIDCATEAELLGELSNVGHIGWDPREYPEWLLLEVENNLLIRERQVQVALEMVNPSAGTNSIMQLNMGEGKSSVIVPMVAAVLADTTKLVRVVVLKPLSNQMFSLLVRRLGGSLRRRIYFLPISRSLRLNMQVSQQIRSTFESCMVRGGILLAQPEHLLSFELMGLDNILSGKQELGKNLIDTQRWLNNHSRDILDESDEILSVNFELIYTIGQQQPVDFTPYRWEIIEDVLKLAWASIPSVLDEFPEGLEVGKGAQGGDIKSLRVLGPCAGDALLKSIGEKICNEGLRGFSTQFFIADVRDAMFRFITQSKCAEADLALLGNTAWRTVQIRVIMLLLRGLISGGVLMFALAEKRYRVNYGLDPSRTMLAVPFRAKDQPSLRSEFSHPDTTIVLTCLSYYAAGLTAGQMQSVFEKLLLSDNPEDEYAEWTLETPDLPPTLRSLSGVNLKDSSQCLATLFPLLGRTKRVINFFLSYIVFPMYMKEFPHKLSTSGWNIAREKNNLTTGFSGTNDSKYILPLSVNQCDLPQQAHTNSMQLDYILRPENTFQHLPSRCKSACLDTETLLRYVSEAQPPIRVIIDVGAQVLELQNEQVAERWLALTPTNEAEAVVYFSSDNELCVLSRDGTKGPLMTSPYEQQMDQCMVYLDEAHTRGTDLTLPRNYRAAVTLGPGLTKDRLVQACMRMRKLASGQSVMFLGPPDVESKILELCGKTADERIEVCDVLDWSISETFVHTRRSIPLWAVQGLRYQRHSNAWSDILQTSSTDAEVEKARLFLEEEALCIDRRYGIENVSPEEKILLRGANESSFSGRELQVNAIREKCREFNLASFHGASVQEMQERELSSENENEVEVERPPPLDPAKHSIHLDVKRFIDLGVLKPFSEAIIPAFQTFKSTSAFRFFEEHAWPEYLLVTADFARTVEAQVNHNMDLYLRPVHWVISRKVNQDTRYLVVSPFEANEYMPLIQDTMDAALHIYSPRVNSSVATLEDLDFCAMYANNCPIPPAPTQMLLNLFAGQTYLKSYEAYKALCRFLGICYKSPCKGQAVQVAPDGFIRPQDREIFDQQMTECRFTTTPVEFLRKLIIIRRQGQGIKHSHIGKILDGSLIREMDFDDHSGGLK